MVFITIHKETCMKKFFTLLWALLLISGIAQGYTYNEAATAQLLEFLSSQQEDCGSKAEALSVARKKVTQFITLVENGANPNIINPDGRELTLLTSVVLLDFFGIIAQTADQSCCAEAQLTNE